MLRSHRSRPILAVEILAVVAGLGQIFIGDRLVELLRSAFQCLSAPMVNSTANAKPACVNIAVGLGLAHSIQTHEESAVDNLINVHARADLNPGAPDFRISSLRC